MRDGAGAARLLVRLRGAFIEEERQGLMFAAKVRSWALLVILAWQILDNPLTGPAYFYVLGEVTLMLLLGVAQFHFIRRGLNPPWAPFVWVVGDVAVLTIIFIAPNPFEPEGFTPAVVLRGSAFVWYFILLMQATFSFRPALVLWCGFCIVLARLGSLFWVLSLSGIYSGFESGGTTMEELQAIYFDPNFVFLGDRINEILAIILTAIGLAVIVIRTRRFVESRSQAERARSKLARYFSPNVVDEITSAGGIGTAAHDQDVAVLFADIIGFTSLCETEPAPKVVALLRDYHSLLADVVFRHGGTLDKYIGDGLMATFGTPRTGPHDATNALACALDMVEALAADWKRQRIAAGESSVSVGVGVHYGVTVVGDIGDERRLEFAVIGDTVNVASRVEHLTRSLGTPLTVSEDLIQAVRREDADSAALLEKLSDAGPQEVRGRRGKIGVWTLAETPAP